MEGSPLLRGDGSRARRSCRNDAIEYGTCYECCVAEQLALPFGHLVSDVRRRLGRTAELAATPSAKGGPAEAATLVESEVQSETEEEKPASGSPGDTGAVIIQAAPGVSDEIQRSAEELTMTLASHFGEAVRLTITDNRRTMVSGGRKQGRLDLRLHRMFLDAPDDVVRALHGYLAHRDRRAGRKIDSFIDAKRSTIRRRQRRISIRTKGTHHDLGLVFAALEKQHFAGALEGVRITWGRRSTRAKQRSIRLGTYTMAEQLIRVHPVLDNDWVPRFYVEAVVFHEMLHHVLPPERGSKRTSFHTPEFRRRERLFPSHQASEAWEKANLNRLLAAASY